MMLPLLLVILVVFPGSAVAAPLFTGGSTVLIATSTKGNIYSAGGTVTVTTAVNGDFLAVGGAHIIDAPITGDLLLIGGSIKVASSVAQDVRLVGGHVTLTDPVGGDLFVVGGSFTDSGSEMRSGFIAAADVTLMKGARGPVTIYGNSVNLAGTFEGDVEAYVAGSLELAPGTHIRGALNYQAPQEASIPDSVVVDGGVHYTGASYLPTTEEARAIAFASFGVFLFVKILGMLLLAALFAGLFPAFAERVIERATPVSARRTLLTFFLGFGVLVAAPVLLTLLAVTFVGLGLAFILTLAYLLLIPLAFVYTAIALGAYIAQRLFRRDEPRWSDAVLGMLALFLIWSLPFLGWFLTLVGVIYLLGVLTHLLFRFAFPREPLNEFEG